MLCTDRPQFAVCLGSSSVFDSVLLPWRLFQGPVRGGVLGWVRMLPTPASTLPQSMHPSTGPQGRHLASPEPPCCRVYGTWVCMGALRSLSCRAGCASRVSLLSVPRRGWLLSALGQQGLSLLSQGAETQESAWDTRYGPQRAVDCDVKLLHVWASAPDRGTVFSCREYQGLCGDPQCFGRGSPGCTSKTTDEWDSRCNLSCYFFKVLLEVQHPVQAHAKVLWSLLKHQAFVVDKHVQFPFSFSVIEIVGGRNCLAYAKLTTPFPKAVWLCWRGPVLLWIAAGSARCSASVQPWPQTLPKLLLPPPLLLLSSRTCPQPSSLPLLVLPSNVASPSPSLWVLYQKLSPGRRTPEPHCHVPPVSSVPSVSGHTSRLLFISPSWTLDVPLRNHLLFYRSLRLKPSPTVSVLGWVVWCPCTFLGHAHPLSSSISARAGP